MCCCFLFFFVFQILGCFFICHYIQDLSPHFWTHHCVQMYHFQVFQKASFIVFFCLYWNLFVCKYVIWWLSMSFGDWACHLVIDFSSGSSCIHYNHVPVFESFCSVSFFMSWHHMSFYEYHYVILCYFKVFFVNQTIVYASWKFPSCQIWVNDHSPLPCSQSSETSKFKFHICLFQTEIQYRINVFHLICANWTCKE